jgi:hypothetical protein
MGEGYLDTESRINSVLKLDSLVNGWIDGESIVTVTMKVESDLSADIYSR